MSDATIQRILGAYGLAPTRILPVQKGYRNESYAATLASGRMVNLILYKREDGILGRIKNANRVADYAAAHGLPARRTASERIVRLQNGSYTTYGALYDYLPGATVPWEAYTMEHIKLLGAGQSDLHAALAAMPRGSLPAVTDEYQAIILRMQTYFATPGVQRALAEKLCLALTADLAAYQNLLQHYKNLPGQQALHMDFVRGNILFTAEKPTRISGILDFEKTAWGHPAFDIARTLAFLLVDCKYKTPAQTRKYFLHSGYHKRGAAPLPDARLIQPLVNLFLLYDFYKFLRHNPYEYLPQNEHFLRTRDCLLKRNMLTRHKMVH